MRKFRAFFTLFVTIAMAGCTGGSTSLTAQPPSTGNGPGVPSSISAATGYRVSIFATPTGSTKPDSIVRLGNSVFIGFGDTVNPDGTPGPSGKLKTEVLQYDLTGTLQKTFSVPGHNDGLMAFDANTLWAMSNEDANPKLVVINVASGAEQTYSAQSSLLGASGGLPHGGGLDDMQQSNGIVYVSGSNPTASASTACSAGSSTPGCPNGVNTSPYVYVLSLNPDGSTFNLTPVATSNTTALNAASSTAGTLNITDPDSEVMSADGSTLIVDGQADSELALIKNPGANQTVSFLPLTAPGGASSVDDTRFVPNGRPFLLLADTPANAIYRIDGGFAAGDAYSSAPTSLDKLSLASGALTPVVSGFKAPHGLAFVTP